MNIVSIMAHQDDEMRCLGTMLRCRERGDTLHFICLTDGSSGVLRDPYPSRKVAAGIRRREMTRLAREIKASYQCLGERDAFLQDTAAVRMKLVEAIRKTGADVIFTHFAEDYNEDHITTHRLVRHCCMIASLPLLPTKSPCLKAHPAVFCVEPHGPIAFAPSHFVDIGKVEVEKVRLLKCHDSQEEGMQKALGAGFDKLCQRPDAYWGEKAGCEYAEAFVPMAARGAIKAFQVLP
jgi:LmbE family N-acetylglucosaminyl deacetylase